MKLIRHLILGVSLVLASLASAETLSVRLEGTTMTVYSDNRAILTWNDYKTHQIYGGYIALLDANNIFGVFDVNGRTIVNNYTKTKQWWFGHDFVAILDSDGVFDAYRLSDGNRFIANWRDTVYYEVRHNHIALLDKDGIFDAYNGDGTAIVRNYRDTKEFKVTREYVAILDKNGIFDVFHRNGKDLIRNWRDTVKYVLGWQVIAVLDRNGILQAYRASDGFEVLRQDQVTDIAINGNGVSYLRGGQWFYFSPQGN